MRAELLYKPPAGFYARPTLEWVPGSCFVNSANTLQTKADALGH